MYTMKMVASARVKKAQSAILSSRPFAAKLEEMLESLEWELSQEDPELKSSWVQWFLGGEPEPDSAGLLLISSDKGLCGGFNTNIFRLAADWLNRNRTKKIKAFAVGKKGRDFLHRIKSPDIEIINEITGIFPKAGYVHAEMIGTSIIESYKNCGLGGLTVICNEFKSLMAQNPTVSELLPLLPELNRSGDVDRLERYEFFFEPEKKLLFEALVPRYIKAQIYRMLLESQAAELAARMNAMESASKNADEIMEELTLKLNRTRQAIITTEIAEIVSGAEALNS